MTKKHIILLVLTVILSFSCTDSFKLKKKIKNLELLQNNSKVSNIYFDTELMPFYASDSANILQKELEIFIKHKEKELNKELRTIEVRKESLVKQLEYIDNKLLYKMIENKVEELETKHKKCLLIIDLYKNNSEQTQVKFYQNTINQYVKLHNKIIGFKIKATFTSKQGTLSKKKVQKTFFVSKDKKTIYNLKY